MTRVPRSIRNLPIRQKVSAIVMLTTSCALLLACGAFIAYDFWSIRQSVAHDLNTLASVVASNSAASLINRDAEMTKEILSALSGRPTIIAAAVHEENGRPFIRYGKGPTPARLGIGPDRLIMRGTTIQVMHAISFRGKRIGTLYLLANRHDLRSRMRMQFATVLLWEPPG